MVFWCYGIWSLLCLLVQEEENDEKKISDDEEGDEMLFDEDFDAEDEAEEEDEDLLEDEGEEGEGEEEEEEVKESAKMKVLRIVAGVASKVKDVIGNLITTAGKVVVTILLGMTGENLLNKYTVMPDVFGNFTYLLGKRLSRGQWHPQFLRCMQNKKKILNEQQAEAKLLSAP